MLPFDQITRDAVTQLLGLDQLNGDGASNFDPAAAAAYRKPTAPQLAQGVANGTLPSQQPTIQFGGDDDQAAQNYRDMRAAKYYASLDGKPGANTLNPLASALFGNQVGAFLNYGNSLDQQYNSPSGPYGQFQAAATAQRPYAAQERIAAMNNQTERQKIGVTSKLVDQLLGSAQNTKPLAGVATDYGAGVAVPYETGPSNWRKYRGKQAAS